MIILFQIQSKQKNNNNEYTIIRVNINRGRNLIPMDSTGKSDPYVKVAICNQMKQTLKIIQCLNPVWNEVLTFEISNDLISDFQGIPIVFQVYDWNLINRHKFMGEYRLTLNRKEGIQTKWVELMNEKKIIDKNLGQICFSIEIVD